MNMMDAMRMVMTDEINNSEVTAEKQWTTAELTEEFTVQGFMAPFVVVTRKADGKRGTLMFKHSPRVYFNWQEDT